MRRYKYSDEVDTGRHGHTRHGVCSLWLYQPTLLTVQYLISLITLLYTLKIRHWLQIVSRKQYVAALAAASRPLWNHYALMSSVMPNSWAATQTYCQVTRSSLEQAAWKNWVWEAWTTGQWWCGGRKACEWMNARQCNMTSRVNQRGGMTINGRRRTCNRE